MQDISRTDGEAFVEHLQQLQQDVMSKLKFSNEIFEVATDANWRKLISNAIDLVMVYLRHE